MHGFGRMLSYEQYPEEKSRLWLSSFKKIDQPSCRGTTRRNYKHIPQIACISSRFRSRWHDAVFLGEVSIGRPKEDEKWKFFDTSADFRAF